jgi:20S proteasome alpha/beta subunit
MTLIVAIACSDGVILCADSASTDPDSMYKQPVEKIQRLGDHPILYGGSGDLGLLQKLDVALAGFQPQANVMAVRAELRRLIVPQLKEAIRLHAPYPRQPSYEPPHAVLLFVGVINGAPWIVEIEKNGADTEYGAPMGNFAAIGSAKPLAQAAFRPHLYTERDLQLGRVFAYRVIEDSINLSAAYVAAPIHMYVIQADGAVRKVGEEEERDLQVTCEAWRRLERETVGLLLAPKKVAPPDIPIPGPGETS